MVVSLLAFNVGVELGQVLVLLVLVPLLALLFRYAVAERMGTIILSAVVGHTGWHWMLERWALLAKYSFTAPALNAATGAIALRWILFFMLIWAALWAVRRRLVPK